jgi:transcriptional regulator with XRE-family HTH domain
MKEKMKEIALRIKELRELSNISAQDMADHLQISENHYQGYEKGTMHIPASILFEIAQKTGSGLGATFNWRRNQNAYIQRN